MELRELLSEKIHKVTREMEARYVTLNKKKPEPKSPMVEKLEEFLREDRSFRGNREFSQSMAALTSILTGERVSAPFREGAADFADLPLFCAVVPTRNNNGHDYPLRQVTVMCRIGDYGYNKGLRMVSTSYGNNLGTNLDDFRFATKGEIDNFMIVVPGFALIDAFERHLSTSERASILVPS